MQKVKVQVKVEIFLLKDSDIRNVLQFIPVDVREMETKNKNDKRFIMDIFKKY